MKITYDPEANAVYLYLTDEPLEAGRDCMPLMEVLTERGEMVVMDWKDGKIVGIEVLNARSILHADLLAEAVPPGPAT